ncbi:MAG: hypothetical protein LW828_10630 [Xanthomonadaceae bacterium]|nr:hypothetical protein [Xanthomonadaceae bacterium]
MIPLPALGARAWAALALVVLVAFAGVQTVRIDRLKADLVEARRTVAEARSAADGHKAAGDARTVAASARRQADALLNAQLIGATACERAEDV